MKLFKSFVGKKEHSKYVDELQFVCEDRNYEISICGEHHEFPIHKIVINPEGRKSVAFVAGIYGDEKGGPYGILEFLKENIRLPKDLKIIIMPLINPVSFVEEVKTVDGININEHFMDEEPPELCQIILNALKGENLNLLHTLREDPELAEFYLYYRRTDEILAKDLRNLAENYFTVFKGKNPLPDGSVILHGNKVYEGIIPIPGSPRYGIEEYFLIERWVPHIITETPGKINIKKRKDYNKEAMKLVIHNI